MKTLIVEGWRGINHSYALVNQNQLLALSDVPDLAIFHRDMPFAFGARRWTRQGNPDGFDAAERRLLDGFPEPPPRLDGTHAVYRICSPFRAGDRAEHGVDFIAAEMRLGARQFASEADRRALFSSDEPIVTPSEWSRQRILESGVRPERIVVVGHGVDKVRFRPSDQAQRLAVRAELGIGADETVFVNVAAPFWHKGTDLLLRAFAELRRGGVKARLLVKDQRALYGRTLESVLSAIGARDERLREPSVVSAITAIGRDLSPERLAALYGAADCYVSPYRAEGFNLPVLEALACGVPAIVTAGGATDDFCDDRLAVRIPGVLTRSRDDDGTTITTIEPEFEALVEAMRAVAAGVRPDAVGFARAREAMLATFNWGRAADGIVRIAFG